MGARLVTLLASCGNSDRSTVHVHFTITNAVEPCPRESVVASGDTIWDRKLEGVRDRGVCTTHEVSGGLNRASALN